MAVTENSQIILFYLSYPICIQCSDTPFAQQEIWTSTGNTFGTKGLF